MSSEDLLPTPTNWRWSYVCRGSFQRIGEGSQCAVCQRKSYHVKKNGMPMRHGTTDREKAATVGLAG